MIFTYSTTRCYNANRTDKPTLRELGRLQLAYLSGLLDTVNDDYQDDKYRSSGNDNDNDDDEDSGRTDENGRIMPSFLAHQAEQLQNPIKIRKLSEAIRRDAQDLHILIDPYQLLLRMYDIQCDVSINMTDMALANFLRNFLDESDCNKRPSSLGQLPPPPPPPLPLSQQSPLLQKLPMLPRTIAPQQLPVNRNANARLLLAHRKRQNERRLRETVCLFYRQMLPFRFSRLNSF
ncbi:uncharacterized protein LOC116846569 [Odontomachus brunneus]|uniref:uncharacterized protein LOC116846569 n=1 Tax=Odontomachus brunneus TaxID=486640 RepID=UPI0013F1F94F|nr:uncharacterized protein LOC116846569 [Odontomachus brunneus]